MSAIGQIEQLFQHPPPEIQRLERDLKKEFGTELLFYIKKMANDMTADYHDECAGVLLGRFVEMNKRLKNLPKKPSKEQRDEMMQELLHLAEPAKISGEIQQVINNTDVYEHYQTFITMLEKDIYYELYQKYAFTKEAVVKLNQSAFVHMQSAMEQLNSYIESLRQHNFLVQEIQENQSTNQVLKVGASILGMGVGIPLLGAGLGKLLSSGNKEKIQDSIGNIFNHIEILEDALYTAVKKLGDSIYLLFLILVGGTFISVNKALYSEHGRIKEMTSEQAIVYVLLNDEAYRFEKWYDTSIVGIARLAQQARWQEAIVVVKRMHEQVAAMPIHARHCIRPNQSALYLTHVHYYAVYQESLLAEYRSGHVDSFLTNGEKFLNTIILFPLAKDFPAFASPPAQFIFLYIKHYMEKHNGRLSWMENAEKYIKERHNSPYLLNGEYGNNPADYAENTTAFYVADNFYVTHENIKYSNRIKKREEQQYLSLISEEDINKLVEIDAAIKHPDALTDYLGTLYGRHKKAKRAPLIKWAWRLGIVAVLLIIMLTFSNSIFEKLQSSKTFIGEKWSAVFMKDEVEHKVMNVKIAEHMVNIRKAPSLQGSVIATGYANETYVFLDEEQLDNDGVTWLTIQLADGRTGYVSKKVAVIQ